MRELPLLIHKFKIAYPIRLSGIDGSEKSHAYGQRAKQTDSDLACWKEVTLLPHDHLDMYGYTIVDVRLLHLNRGRNTPWYRCELDC